MPIFFGILTGDPIQHPRHARGGARGGGGADDDGDGPPPGKQPEPTERDTRRSKRRKADDEEEEEPSTQFRDAKKGGSSNKGDRSDRARTPWALEIAKRAAPKSAFMQLDCVQRWQQVCKWTREHGHRPAQKAPAGSEEKDMGAFVHRIKYDDKGRRGRLETQYDEASGEGAFAASLAAFNAWPAHKDVTDKAATLASVAAIAAVARREGALPKSRSREGRALSDIVRLGLDPTYRDEALAAVNAAFEAAGAPVSAAAHWRDAYSRPG